MAKTKTKAPTVRTLAEIADLEAAIRARMQQLSGVQRDLQAQIALNPADDKLLTDAGVASSSFVELERSLSALEPLRRAARIEDAKARRQAVRDRRQGRIAQSEAKGARLKAIEAEAVPLRAELKRLGELMRDDDQAEREIALELKRLGAPDNELAAVQ